MDHRPLGSSVRGILEARILGWVTIPFSRWSSFGPRIKLVFPTVITFILWAGHWSTEELNNWHWVTQGAKCSGAKHAAFHQSHLLHRPRDAWQTARQTHGKDSVCGSPDLKNFLSHSKLASFHLMTLCTTCVPQPWGSWWGTLEKDTGSRGKPWGLMEQRSIRTELFLLKELHSGSDFPALNHSLIENTHKRHMLQSHVLFMKLCDPFMQLPFIQTHSFTNTT